MGEEETGLKGALRNGLNSGRRNEGNNVGRRTWRDRERSYARSVPERVNLTASLPIQVERMLRPKMRHVRSWLL